jgi:predicted permease
MRQILRSLVRTPGFTIAAVLSLAIGIGANTAIFSVAYAILLRPLPYANADRLTILWNRSPGLNIAEDWFSTAQYYDIKNGHSGFEAVAIAGGNNVNLTGGGGPPERVGGLSMSPNLLTMLGATAVRGRLFADTDGAPGAPAVAMISHGLWQRRFGGDPDIAGKPIVINGAPVSIVGVLAPGFSIPREVMPTLGVVDNGDIYTAYRFLPTAATFRGAEDYNVVGLLKPGVTVAAAQTEMDALTARLRREFPDVYPPNGGLTFSIVPMQEQVAGKITRPLLIVSSAVAFVLLIACANVANLLMSRAVSRHKEMAVRAALGAGRGRIVRMLMAEGAMLSAAGGVIGVALAAIAVRWIHAAQPKDLPRLGEIGINMPVLAFTIGLSLFAALLFSLAPAISAGHADPLGAMRGDLAAALGSAARGSSSMGALWGRGRPTRRLLVAGELALAVMLLVGAGLLIRSLDSLQHVPPGFVADGVATMEVTLTAPNYRNAAEIRAGYARLWERLEAMPGVTAAGGVSSLPLSGFFAWGPITVEGRVPPPGEKFINADQRSASRDYFRTMRIPLVKGRLFDESDYPPPIPPSTPAQPTQPPAPRVVLIDELMAATLWPDADPIGKRIKPGDASSTSAWETVVGVVGRVKQYGLDADARMAFYRPNVARAMFITVRTSGRTSDLLAALPGAMHAFDPDLPLYHLRSMSSRVDASLARARFLTSLLTAFAVLAMLLAAVGIYGVMAYLVTQSTREIGIRVALGATPRGILGMVLGHGALITAAGLIAGAAGAFGLARFIESQLFGVTSHDPATFAIVSATLAIVALAAVAIPAVRAARIDPIDALRAD